MHSVRDVQAFLLIVLVQLQKQMGENCRTIPLPLIFLPFMAKDDWGFDVWGAWQRKNGV